MTQKSKILIIDDEPRIRCSLKELLSREGYKILTKNNGSTAIDILQKESFDLVLLDLFLPDSDGYQIIDFINAHNPEIPIIVMTGYPSIESAIKALQKGAHDYLRKPIDTDELLIRIRTALEHKKLKYDHKQAIKSNEQQNVFLKTIIDSLQHPFCVLDADNYQVIMANSITYQGETVTTPKCFASDNPRSASEGDDNVSNLREQVKKKKKPVKVEHAHQDNDGNMRFFEVHGFPILDDKGNVIQMIEYDIDITDRKRADETLADAKEELNSILKSVPDVIYRLDSEGNITFITDSIRQYGYSPEELLGKDVMDIICPEDREDAVYRINERRTGERGTKSHQLRLLPKSPGADSLRVFNISAEGLYDSEKPQAEAFIGTQGIARDVTELKELEDQFQQGQKMQAIGTLAGGIAHDFNNLLMGIQGNVSIMLFDMKSDHPFYNYLKNMEVSIENGGDLTKQLVGFAKGGKYEVKTIDLNELIKTHNRIYGRMKKEVKVRGVYEKDLWAVDVDKSQIQQVLMNLYVNAWQAMPNGGELHIRTENIILDENYTSPFNVEAGRYVKISVTDTGTGIDKEIQPRIFDPFFTTKDIGKGAGLGLASVYGIIKNHKGIINVYSEKGKGTIFNISLPASAREVVEEPKISEPVLNGSGIILIVDDENMILEISAEMLKTIGYEVLTTQSGKEAIDVYRKNRERISLVILDMIIPGMNGGETYDRLKKLNPDIQVLLSSGYSINGEATKILDRGCSGFIQKPFSIKQLSQKIREILDM